MADLVTTIAADDREFRDGIARVDARLSGFTGSVSRASRLARGLMGGFGAAAAIAGVTHLAERIKEIGDESDAATASLQRLGQAAVDAGKARERSFSGAAETSTDIRVEAEKQITELRDQYNERIQKLKDITSPWMVHERGMYLLSNREQPETTISRLEQQLKQEEARIRAQSVRTATSKENRDTRDYWDSQYNAEREWKDFQKNRRATLNDLRDNMTDEKVNLLDAAGLGNAADTARLKERLRRKMEEIDQNDILSPYEKRVSRDFYEEAYKSNKMLLDQQSIESWRSKAKSFQGNIGGATFQQQMADIQRPLNTVAEEIRDQVIQAVEKLDEISAKSGSPSYR